jgi:hypothetical protein
MKQALPKLILAEKQNVPRVLKELTIVVTPGVLIAFVVALAVLTSKRNLHPVEWRLTEVIAVSALSLMLAYSMLVFDGRYIFPLIPLVVAVGARFLIADAWLNHNVWRRISLTLVVLGVGASLVYPSSPFRVLTRDFQDASYEAGALLRKHPASARIVSIGSGPFPEHGMGWEAGCQAAYFGGARLIGTMDSLPGSTESTSLMADLRKAAPDAILVWGKPNDGRYTALVGNMALGYPYDPAEKIVDPVLGEVGVVVFTSR